MIVIGAGAARDSLRVGALPPAAAAPGFCWRLQTEDGNATSVQAFEWDRAAPGPAATVGWK